MRPYRLVPRRSGGNRLKLVRATETPNVPRYRIRLMQHRGPQAEIDDTIVVEVVRDSGYVECGDELGKGRGLRMEQARPLCMSCAGLAHLVFLPPGNAALTRRASKYSALRAVLVRVPPWFARHVRQRYPGCPLNEARALAEQACGARLSQAAMATRPPACHPRDRTRSPQDVDTWPPLSSTTMPR